MIKSRDKDLKNIFVLLLLTLIGKYYFICAAIRPASTVDLKKKVT